MSWLLDGNNVLGRLGVSRDAVESKRELVRVAARFARAKRVRVVCYFDGPDPGSFGKHLGGVSVVFGGRTPADELIARKVGEGSQWHVVTSDQGLAARIGGRKVTIVAPHDFLAEAERVGQANDPAGSADEWSAYFSDPKNRNVF